MEIVKFLSFLAVVLPVAYGAPTEAIKELHPDILAAMKRDFGLSADQAVARVAEELHASSLIEKLRDSTGPSFAGAWINARKVFVGITDQAMADRITAQGAVPVAMNTPLSKLEAAKATIDDIFRGHSGPKRSTNDAIASFYVDEAANKVVFRTLASGRAQAQDLAKQAGLLESEFAVQIVNEMPIVKASVRGGDAYLDEHSSFCSVGFSVNGGFVSAGHCGEKGGGVKNVDGTTLGTFAESTFPGDADMSYIKTVAGTKLTGYVNSYGKNDLPIAGKKEAAVGASICRSGRTTGFHCGTVTAKNVTVNYSGDGTVRGLTETNACAESGDSGGAYIAGDQAQGVLSGGTLGCGGGSVTTYFQPLNKILDAYKLTLVTV